MIPLWVQQIVHFLPFVFFIPGAIAVAQLVAMPAEFFELTNRQQKWVWVALMGGASLSMVLTMPILMIIGLVLLGLYWFDIRPDYLDLKENTQY